MIDFNERAIAPSAVAKVIHAGRVPTSRNTRTRIHGGTGKFEGASGGGTYTLEELTKTLLGGKYKGSIEMP
jgi:hypothetical protein